MRRLKEFVKKIFLWLDMPYEYFMDFVMYKKWNYNSKNVTTQGSYEAKIFRLTHVLEKGMSLSDPRLGYGKEKIQNLLKYLYEYNDLGFNKNATAYQDAIVALQQYIEFHKKLNYENEEYERAISGMLVDVTQPIHAGVIAMTSEELEKMVHGEFPEFFNSRHSVRQFSSRPVAVEVVAKAVEIAKKAPSACNRQSCKVYYFNSLEVNEQLGKVILGNNGFEKEVRKYLVVTSDISAFYDPFERNQAYVDGGIFAMALVESLHYYGVGSCILQNGENYLRSQKIHKILPRIPVNEKIILYIAIGYYKEAFNVAVSQRKRLDEVLKVI
jgi:nitroreductase